MRSLLRLEELLEQTNFQFLTPNSGGLLLKNFWWHWLNYVTDYFWLVHVKKKIYKWYIIAMKNKDWGTNCHIFVQMTQKINFSWACGSITNMMIRPTGSKFNHIYIEPDEELLSYFQSKRNMMGRLKISKKEIRCIWPSEGFVVIKIPRSSLTNIFD